MAEVQMNEALVQLVSKYIDDKKDDFIKIVGALKYDSYNAEETYQVLKTKSTEMIAESLIMLHTRGANVSRILRTIENEEIKEKFKLVAEELGLKDNAKLAGRIGLTLPRIAQLAPCASATVLCALFSVKALPHVFGQIVTTSIAYLGPPAFYFLLLKKKELKIIVDFNSISEDKLKELHLKLSVLFSITVESGKTILSDDLLERATKLAELYSNNTYETMASIDATLKLVKSVLSSIKDEDYQAFNLKYKLMCKKHDDKVKYLE